MIDMRLVPFVAAIALVCLPQGACAGERADWSTTGRDLFTKCTSSDETVVHACGEYLLGVMDGVVAALPANAQLICPPSSISFFQLESAYGKWGKENAELLDESRLRAAVQALSATFPCR